MSQDSFPPDASSRRHRAARERDAAEYDHRHFINLVSAAFLLLLALAMVWTVKAFDAQETLRECFGSGRKDCVQMPSQPRELRQAVR